ncbi:oxidoreductase [Vulgatibacter sp.]|uniref:oxidoreductase n=1 Tax=Vulgatibacter sp. TaxID=1971226 RepID=UPI00356376E4
MIQSSQPSPLAPRRLEVFDTVLREIVWETHDTVTLVLDPGEHHRNYTAGQFVSIDPGQFRELKQQIAYFEKAKGKREPVRAYSMASTPDEPHLAITVKEEEFLEDSTEFPPLLSPLLVHGLEVGRKITVKGYSGFYHLPPDVMEQTGHVVHVTAGSGVVPNFAMVKWALRHLPDLRHTFVYSNKTWADTIFARQLTEMEQGSGGRLRVLHCLTREPSVPAESPCARLGRINTELLADAIPDPESCLVFACGPAITRWDKKAARARGEEPKPRFLETVKELLAERGVPRQRLHTEAYG